MEEEKKQQEIDRKIQEQIKNGTWKQNIASSDNNKQSSDTSQKSNDSIEQSNENPSNECVQELSESNDVSKKSDEIEENVNIHENAQKSNENDDSIIQLDEIEENLKSPSKCPFKHLASTENQNGEVNTTNEKLSSEECQAKLDSITTENDGQKTDDHSKVKSESIMKELPLNHQPVVLPGGIVMPPPRVETVNGSWKTQHLTTEQVNDYCKKLFKFKIVSVMHFQ